MIIGFPTPENVREALFIKNNIPLGCSAEHNRANDIINSIAQAYASGKLVSTFEEPKEYVPHVIEEGNREHVIYYDSKGEHCKCPNCEINKPINVDRTVIDNEDLDGSLGIGVHGGW